MNNVTALLIFAALLIITLGALGNYDYEDAVAQQTTYCQMADIWYEEKRMGVPAEDRRGHPNYDGRECK